MIVGVSRMSTMTEDKDRMLKVTQMHDEKECRKWTGGTNKSNHEVQNRQGAGLAEFKNARQIWSGDVRHLPQPSSMVSLAVSFYFHL